MPIDAPPVVLRCRVVLDGTAYTTDLPVPREKWDAADDSRRSIWKEQVRLDLIEKVTTAMALSLRVESDSVLTTSLTLGNPVSAPPKG